MINLERLQTKGSKAEKLLYHCVQRDYGHEWLPTSFDSQLSLKRAKTSHTPRYRYDFQWLYPSIDLKQDVKVAVEVQGGVYGGKSGHNTGKGIMRDMAKVNFAQVNNYVIFLVHGHATDSEMCEFLRMVLGVVASKRGKQLTRLVPSTSIDIHRPKTFDGTNELDMLQGVLWE